MLTSLSAKTENESPRAASIQTSLFGKPKPLSESQTSLDVRIWRTTWCLAPTETSSRRGETHGGTCAPAAGCALLQPPVKSHLMSSVRMDVSLSSGKPTRTCSRLLRVRVANNYSRSRRRARPETLCGRSSVLTTRWLRSYTVLPKINNRRQGDLSHAVRRSRFGT